MRRVAAPHRLPVERHDKPDHRRSRAGIRSHARRAGTVERPRRAQRQPRPELAALSPALAYQAGAHVYKGEFTSATRLLDEADAITESIGYAPRKYHALNLAAWRGVHGEAVDLIAAAAADGAAKGEGRLVGLTKLLSAILYNGLGRYDEALASARECVEYEDLGFFGWCLFELIEAAVHVGDTRSAA